MDLIGTLEEIVLLILLNKEKLTSVDIAKDYEAHLDRNISLPAIHVVLKRMEKKGYVESAFGAPSAERGGRRKRLYWATTHGYHVVASVHQARSGLWSTISKPSLK